jgi:hypothetical protein
VLLRKDGQQTEQVDQGLEVEDQRSRSQQHPFLSSVIRLMTISYFSLKSFKVKVDIIKFWDESFLAEVNKVVETIVVEEELLLHVLAF